MAARNWPAITLASVLAAIAFLLAYYSQSIAFTWDAGFHLLAAQLVNAGKRPYLDFCFPQTPLNVWWMAFWMRALGQSWRVAQGLAAFATWGAAALAATYVFGRFPVARWRLAAAVVTAVLFSFNELVFRFGTIAQSYGICMFLTVAAFRVAVVTPERRGFWAPAAAGVLAGAAAGCSLLSALAAPPLAAWIALYSRKGSRWMKCAAFLVAAAIPFLPMAPLFVEGPGQTWFNIFQYQAAYRHAHWGNTAGHDLVEMTSWLNSTQALVLLLLAAAALWFLRRPECGPQFRSEFYLCGWLALALGIEVAVAHPTFTRYFVLTAPFLAILAGAGFYEVATRLRGAQSRPLVPVLLLCLLIAMGAGRAIYNNGENYRWRDLQKVATKIRQVTAPDGLLYASEPLYFLLHTMPPEGMQFAYAQDLELPPAESARLHIVRQRDLENQIKAGHFATVAICMDKDTVDRLKLDSLYTKTQEVEYCNVFWDWASHAAR
jgi:4-amino-4-deoxy-L-arabinose transferase-like glycosyltransferase